MIFILFADMIIFVTDKNLSVVVRQTEHAFAIQGTAKVRRSQNKIHVHKRQLIINASTVNALGQNIRNTGLCYLATNALT